ncbi:hypothetical protein ASPACDRAFT_128304 [Aspergillus aculeatus ATCC 16872]|uniref:Uncharacterized protein n=1 Tax=Aspergillus aculeatus (strain ATCC 16872 / CBS 172.66 / WB 5094) TaxID=690307 RepID=A0A1L9WEQ9_ASPA1|nr:uncharacterized protein ASPACDRAFT_128304 [Aspergillus aculeatus ATCC 16872]OJJ94577.1 hypothetical protein ASPACDRAFT_128304 [Aspergillus aculeatus ATCC 16872]
MDWDRNRRFDDHRGGESYRPAGSRGYSRRSRSPPRVRSPRLVADTWVPSNRTYGRARSRSPAPSRRRPSRSPHFYSRDTVLGSYQKASSPPRRFSPRREGRNRSPHQSLWRSRSPYGDGPYREMSWGRSTPKRLREASPPGRNFRQPRRDRPSLPADKYSKAELPARDSSGRTPLLHRPRTPLHTVRRDWAPEIGISQKRSSPSAKGEPSPAQTSASASLPNSRRSSPVNERSNAFPDQIRDRSPSHRTLICYQPRNSDYTKLRESPPGSLTDKPRHEEVRPRVPAPDHASTATERRSTDRDHRRRSSDAQFTGKAHMPAAFHPNSVPTQPKAYNAAQSQAPPSGPSHGLRVLPQQNRGSNISLLSAPTRPRGGASFKDNSWLAASARRGGASVGLHGAPPTGPRSSLPPTTPITETTRQLSGRQNSLPGHTHSRVQKISNHLSGLRAIVTEGRPFSSGLNISMEKRLSQLDIDKDRLIEQTVDHRKLIRLGAHHWDKLDRESSICALKSELAEGHLQRISDSDSIHLSTTF